MCAEAKVFPPASPIAPLPWRWFEFRRAPVAVRLPAPADPDAVYAIKMDGEAVPFKVLRAANGEGSRPAVLLLHGMGITIASFRGVAPYLLATHDLILPDYSGLSQDTAALPENADFRSFAQGVWRLADALGVERLSLVGNSLGGGLALMAALQAPERVERIILSNPAWFPQELPSSYRMVRVPVLGELVMGMTSPEKLIGGLEYIGYTDRTRFDPALRGIYAANLATRRNRFRLMQMIRELPADPGDRRAMVRLPELGTVRAPVLLSWGQRDPLLAEGSGDRLAAALGNVRYEAYPELSHMPHEEAPEVVGPRWARFLNGLERDSSIPGTLAQKRTKR